MKHKVSIQRYYKIYFFVLIVIPIIIILIISLFLLYRQSQKTLDTNLKLTEKNIVDTLEYETSSYGIQLSKFLLTNNNQTMDIASNYNNSTGQQRYEYQSELKNQFEMFVTLYSKLISFDFYFDNGTRYSFKNTINVSTDFMKEQSWYYEAKKNTGRIYYWIVNNDTLYNNRDLVKDQRSLMFVFSPNSYDTQTSIDFCMMNVKSDGIKKINTVSEWAKDTSIYLVDELGNVLVGSDDLHINQISDMINNKSDIKRYSVASVQPTNWKVITVMNKSKFLSQNKSILFVIFLCIILLFITFYYFIANLIQNILKPVSQLSKSMEKLDISKKYTDIQVLGPSEVQIIQAKFNQMIHRIQQLIKQNKSQIQEKHKEEMLALELQLNPHFLANTLNSIRFMAIISKYEGIQKMTESLINILEVSFRNTNSFHTVEEELKILDAYIYIMKIRYANNFEVEFNVDKECLNKKVPKLFLQPFIENSIEHGFEKNDNIGKICVYIKNKGDKVYFEVYDNGKGMDEDKIHQVLSNKESNGKKVGIVNINKRLALYFGKGYKLNIESEVNKYTKAYFYIPNQNE